jgi:hypothetical protein
MEIHSHPDNADLMGMLLWCQDHIDELTEADDPDVEALHAALMRAVEVGPDDSLTLKVLSNDAFEKNADLWAVVLRIADRYELVPADEDE